MRVGFFKGMFDDYKEGYVEIDVYKSFKNTIKKEFVLNHLKSLMDYKFISGRHYKSLIDDKTLMDGFVEDGDFIISLGFIYMYEHSKLGIPYEYEKYLKEILND